MSEISSVSLQFQDTYLSKKPPFKKAKIGLKNIAVGNVFRTFMLSTIFTSALQQPAKVNVDAFLKYNFDFHANRRQQTLVENNSFHDCDYNKYLRPFHIQGQKAQVYQTFLIQGQMCLAQVSSKVFLSDVFAETTKFL